MAGNTKDVFGFELLQKSVDNDICKKEDVIILLVHWYIIKCGFKCIGHGASKIFDPSERGTELLPENWNKGPNYTLRYLKDGKLFLLYGIKSDEDILINLLRSDDESITNIQFPLQIVNELHGPLELMIPTYQTVLYKISKELVEALNPSDSKETSTQTSATGSEREPRSTDSDRSRFDPPSTDPLRIWNDNPLSDPRRVGGADLDPLGRSRDGGMIFNPFGARAEPRGMGGLGVPGRLPLGAIPPHARFDPFGPPDIDPMQRRPRNRDNDELPPPGYDDMFM